MTKSTFALALAATLLLAPAAARADEALGAESPQALVEKLRSAAEKEDFGELAACLAPQARLEMAQGIWVAATMMIAMGSSMGDMAAGMGEAMSEDDAQAKEQSAKAKAETEAKFGPWKKRYDETAKKHGLPTLDQNEMEGDPSELFAKVDALAVTRDFGALLQDFGKEQGQAKGEGKKVEGQLENLKIDGDNAEGTLAGDPIRFVKIDGRWYISELPQGGSPAEGG